MRPIMLSARVVVYDGAGEGTTRRRPLHVHADALVFIPEETCGEASGRPLLVVEEEARARGLACSGGRQLLRQVGLEPICGGGVDKQLSVLRNAVNGGVNSVIAGGHVLERSGRNAPCEINCCGKHESILLLSLIVEIFLLGYKKRLTLFLCLL